jgi:adenine-specific DNA-methyltransferase
MPTSSHQHFLTLDDLRFCDEIDGVRRLFARLGYAAPSEPTPLKSDFALPPADDAVIDRVYRIADQTDRLQILLFRSKPPHDAAASGAHHRSIAAHLLARGGDFLLIFADAYPFQKLTFVNPRRVVLQGAEPRIQIRKLAVDIRRPTRHDLDILASCAAKESAPRDTFLAQCNAFASQRIAQKFYREYAELRQSLQERIQDANPGVRVLQSQIYAFSFTQRLLERLLFLYFLQTKGWFAADPEFLTTQYRQTVHAAGKEYYSDFCEPLFFHVLNRPRPNDESPWGALPDLGGGLFDQEYDAPIHLPNRLFDPQSSGSLLEFFNRYNFSLEENTPLEQQAALNPDIVGMAFESLLQEKVHGGSAASFTPRPIVQYLCRETLLDYFHAATRLDRALLRAQFDEETERALAESEANTIQAAARGIRVLDPAVASGTFLLEVLRGLVTLRRACQRALGDQIPPTGSLIAKWKRESITHCLYGVDTRREAIAITKWRLWLTWVADAERNQWEPLPNLDDNVIRGNLLIETLGGQPILSAPDSTTGTRRRPATQLSLGISETERAMGALRALKQSHTNSDPSERVALQKKIEEQEAWIVLTHLRELQGSLEQRMKVLLRKGRQVQWKEMAQEKKQLAAWQDHLVKIGALMEEIRRGAMLPFFLYRLHFGDIFEEKGGFDLVLGKLPATQSKWTSEQRMALQSEYARVYDPRSDASVYYFARGLDLLRPGGFLALLSDRGLMRNRAAKRLRQMLIDETSIHSIVEIKTAHADDAGAAAIVCLQKTKPESEHLLRAGTLMEAGSPEEFEDRWLWQSQPMPQARLGSDRWLMGAPAESA